MPEIKITIEYDEDGKVTSVYTDREDDDLLTIALCKALLKVDGDFVKEQVGSIADICSSTEIRRDFDSGYGPAYIISCPFSKEPIDDEEDDDHEFFDDEYYGDEEEFLS